jgi:hypothetical protein
MIVYLYTMYLIGIDTVLTVLSWAFYFCIDVCNLCKLLFQTQFLSIKFSNNNYYLYYNIPQIYNTRIAGECEWLFHWQHKLCATFSASVNINYRLPINVYYRICTLRHIRIEINHGIWKTVIYIYACGKCRTQFMLPMEKSFTFTGACANEIIPNGVLGFNMDWRILGMRE